MFQVDGLQLVEASLAPAFHRRDHEASVRRGEGVSHVQAVSEGRGEAVDVREAAEAEER